MSEPDLTPLERPCFTREFRLLVACSWRPPEPFRTRQIQAIRALAGEGLDWRGFLALVERHRIPALVHTNLAEHASALLPESILEALRARSMEASGGSLRYAAELVRLAKAFNKAGIPMLAMKGVVLSQHLYGKPALRGLKDLDLLVGIEDLDRAEQVLRQQGYHRTFPSFNPTPRMKAAILERSHHYAFEHRERKILVELHWTCEGSTSGFSPHIWEGGRQIKVAGTLMRHLDDKALLRLLILHGSGHQWFRLKWLSDVAMLVALDSQGGGASMQSLAEQDSCCADSIIQVSLLLHWIYQIEPPDWVRQRVQENPKAAPFAVMALQALLGDEPSGRSGVLRTHVWRWRYLRLQNNRPGLLRFLAGIALRPLDATVLRLPDRFFFIYFLARPFLWVWRRFGMLPG